MTLPTRALGALQVSAIGLGRMRMSTNHRPDHIREAVEASLRRLGTTASASSRGAVGQGFLTEIAQAKVATPTQIALAWLLARSRAAESYA